MLLLSGQNVWSCPEILLNPHLLNDVFSYDPAQLPLAAIVFLCV